MRRLALPLALLVVAGCDNASNDDDGARCEPPSDATADAPAEADAGADTGAAVTETPLRPAANPTEYVAFSVEAPAGRAEFDALGGPLLGADAAAGRGHRDFVFQNGIRLTSEVDPRTAEQLVLTVEMETATGDEPAQRVVARVPASTAYGAIWFDAVEAAIATADAKLERGETMEAFRIEHRARSANGGNLTTYYDFDGVSGRFGISVQGPRTSLLSGRVNEPAQSGAPFESVYGRVNFQVDRDEFSFFVNRAYGISEGAAQNFNDFYLLPHEWLRLTVTPQLDDDRVDVGFEVVTLDGRRVPIARAPASLLGGEQFMQTVFRMYENMADGEIATPGSGTTWTAPFYYDDPNGGGVVEVIANGHDGVMRIAYAVESPIQTLQDVDFVPYQGQIVIPDDWDAVDPTCAEIGASESAQGEFKIRFAASTTVRHALGDPATISGPIWGSVYRARDVRITGPIDGAEPVVSFAFDDVVIGDGPTETVYELERPIPAGDYQMLGFMDVDGNADPESPDPDEGDPVMIPIGGFQLRCDTQPITAEFALLLPAGR
ncbi:MAG: hypothetical protein H6697_00220 [Myxococcales bacterium]|nr:hypothetical protein [Myxococcales bacterium]MCB9520067.1 hypothetical protein [Myxococcales bacterium]